MIRITKNPWAYDIVLDHYRASVVYIQHEHDLLHQIQDARSEALLAHTRETGASTLADRMSLQGPKEMITKVLANEMAFLKHMEKTRPIAINWSTLDSLIGVKPENYEYVNNKQLPFDNMFFDFRESYPMQMPLRDFERDLIGIAMSPQVRELGTTPSGTTPGTTPIEYLITAFFAKDGKVANIMDVRTNYGKDSMFQCSIDDHASECAKPTSANSPNESTTHFLILPTQKKVYTSNTIGTNLRIQEKILGRGTLSASDFDSSLDYDPETNPDGTNGTIAKVVNLTVNLINYINSHNVSVQEKTRIVEFLVKKPNDRRRKRTENQKYYLTIVKDEEVTVGTEIIGGTGAQLDFRLYVRGHDRTYRTDDGSPKQKIWIKPCIKGPADKPFYNQRHYVSAVKLLQERGISTEKLGTYRCD